MPQDEHDRVPPSDMVAEAAILATCLLTGSLAIRKTGLRPEHFYSDANRKIFEAMTALELEGHPLDVLTLRGYLEDRGHLQRIGGPRYLAEILDTVPAVANVAEYADRIRSKATLRETIAIARQIVAEAYSATDAASLLSGARKQLEQIQTQRRTLELLPPGWLTTPLPPKQWVCRQLWIGPGRPTMMSGYGYSGKSVIAMHLCGAVALGQPIWGQYRVANPGPVLHIDHEQGRDDTIARYQRLARACGWDLDELEANLAVSCLPRRFRLSNSDAEDILEDVCAGRKLCMIDSLTNSTPGVDQISIDIGHHVAKFMGVSDRTGCSFLFIHHDAKGGKDRDPKERAKGNGAIYGNCGTVFQLVGAVQDDGSTIAEVMNTKVGAGGGKPLAPFAIKIDDVLSESGQENWGLSCEQMSLEQIKPPTTPQQDVASVASDVLAIVTANPGCSTNFVRGLYRGKGSRLIPAALEWLEKAGAITSGTGKSKAWSLSAEGEQ